MCGGEQNLPDGVFSGTCPYCNSLTTFPRVSEEYIRTLYNRAEQLRRNNDYDRAIEAYSQLIAAAPEEPEAYWGSVLCRFGIEYVEDPVTHERIPTCHRVQFDHLLSDADYLNAIKYAGSVEKEIYRKEAERIANVQKDILAISNREEKFDIFICYKENDARGKRTIDSVIAQDVYNDLTKAGYKVFFARITLESKLGAQYEPYIFAALNSAKIMLVIGSCQEHFNAVWVKNEWSRFIALMKKDRSKLLIPCCKNMDFYDMPKELSIFQAQDMNKIGFMQDILHGIQKVIIRSDSAPAAPSTAATGKNHPLLRRAKIFLKEANYSSAYQYCEKALDQEPENGWAYFYELLAELNCSNEEQLREFFHIDRHELFRKALEFADDELRAELNKICEFYNSLIQQYNDNFVFSDDRSAILAVKPGVVLSEELIIPPGMGLCRIADNVFMGRNELKKVVIPDGVSGIDSNVFLNCANLQTVILPGTLQYIGSASLANCTSLTSIVIPEGVMNLGNNLFYGCTNLSSVSLPSTIKFIGQNIFAYCPPQMSVISNKPQNSQITQTTQALEDLASVSLEMLKGFFD